MIIAIDGPAGAGKSTVAKAVAKTLDYGYLDTGAMYRAVTYAALKRGVDLDDKAAVAEVAATARLDLDNSHILVDGEDATEAIRLPSVGRAVSIVSSVPEVRSRLVEKQRELAAKAANVVVEGRDIGTVVFPAAELKIFLTAAPAARAHRRLIELRGKGVRVGAVDVETEIKARDTLDSKRAASPLERAEDAVLVDTTDKTIQEVVDLIAGMAAG